MVRANWLNETWRLMVAWHLVLIKLLFLLDLVAVAMKLRKHKLRVDVAIALFL